MNYKVLIIGIIIAAMSIIGASIAIGISTRDIEVVDNAYEAGLHFDHDCARKKELGWQVHLPRKMQAGSAVIPVQVIDRYGKALRDAEVTLKLSRRGGHEMHAYRCTGEGRYLAAVQMNKPGYWDARIEVTRLNDSVRFDDMMYVQ